VHENMKVYRRIGETENGREGEVISALFESRKRISFSRDGRCCFATGKKS
jgi:hypothetical protein